MMRSILVLAIAAGMSACGEDLFGECADTVKAEAVSPSGRYVATVFERNCGATTDYSTHISLSGSGESFDSSKGTRVLTLGGKEAVAIDWSADGTLSVALPEGATAFTRLETWRDVRIVYR